MKRTTAAGSVGGLYVNEIPGVQTGTAADAADANMNQEELVNAVEAAGLVLDGTGVLDDQLAEAMQKLIAECSKLVGELFFLPDLRAVHEWDRAAPEDYFAGVCLDDTDHDLAPANYPDLVPYLLTRALTYKDGIAGQQSAHNVTTWAVAGGVATLTFANSAPEIAILTALLEDEAVHGSYVGWRSITLAASIGNILAGTYAITLVDPAARQIKFAAAVADGGAGGAWTVQFFTHKIAGSASARVFVRKGGVLMSANDPDNEAIPGLRRRDRMQGHLHGMTQGGAAGTYGVPNSSNAVYTPYVPSVNTGVPITDAVNGTPRTGKSTDPRNATAHLYQWARRYLP